MIAVAALLCGVMFGFGLALSGMTDVNRVLGFLDLFGAWDPTLLFVMGSAVLLTLVGYPLLKRRGRPLFAERFQFPAKRSVDGRLLAGAALFGTGWGLYGYCPGPALTALQYGAADTVLFVLAMLAGMAIAARIPQR